ncbi:hypothetical protein JCGZ_24800 [Jatropha curcas]|uniref:Uncharacterized protein n=1 Tax=Jatropha curcas TaxID=180498 RepID=A0A067KX80_JATCU|nr:uncharacterized protein LOC105631490 [Jatropha curcas]KDP40801.1 hypothetical protein JCGZ_24800 [Jatropha curcas]
MASKLPQLQSKLHSAAKHGCAFYKQLLEENKQYIQNPPTVERCQLLANQLLFTRLASIPNRYEAFWKELEGLKNLMKSKPEMNIEKAGLVALFGVECFAWFWGGEIIGRGFTFTGYYV